MEPEAVLVRVVNPLGDAENVRTTDLSDGRLFNRNKQQHWATDEYDKQ